MASDHRAENNLFMLPENIISTFRLIYTTYKLKNSGFFIFQ